MSDSGLSREFLRSLARRCNTQLDHDFMCYVSHGREYTVILALERWTAKTVGSTLVIRSHWARADGHMRRRIMSDLIKRVAVNGALAPADPYLPEDFVERFPGLAEFLRVGRYADGAPRKRSAITLLAGETEGFRAVLNDPDNNRGLWATAKTVEGLFVVLEALVGDPKAPWKPSKPPHSRR